LNSYEIFGFIGAASINIAFIPQVYRLFKLKSAREISLPFTILLTFGNFAWLVYGLTLSLPSVIIANISATILNFLMIYAKLKYGRIPAHEKHS